MCELRKRASVRRCRDLRMHDRVVLGWLLQGSNLCAAFRSGHQRLRRRRQHLWCVCVGAGLRQWRLQLRRRVVLGMLLGGRLRAIGARHVRAGWGAVHVVRAEAAMQRTGSVRLQRQHLPGRMLRRGPALH
jgi:hypothetical protein